MRRYLTLLALAFLLLFSACSYISNFVVVNDSENPVDVRYRIKDSPYELFQLVPEPAKAPGADLRGRNNQWAVLESGDYRLDPQARTITVKVQPHEALRLLYISNYPGHQDASGGTRFEIDEIVLTGSRGEIVIRGDDARKKFAEESESLYVLTYK